MNIHVPSPSIKASVLAIMTVSAIGLVVAGSPALSASAASPYKIGNGTHRPHSPKPTASATTSPTSSPSASPSPSSSPSSSPSPSVTPSPSSSPSPSPTSTPSGLVVGINDHPVWMRASQDTVFSYIKNAGARSVRIDVPWDLIEPSRGSYDSLRLGLIDGFVNRAALGGVDVLMIVNNAPQWANGSTDPHVAPLNNNDYANYLQFLITRYSGKVSEFEIWNEPNGGWAWTNPDPVKYANLLKVAYTRAKSVNPAVTILAPSLSGPDQGVFLDKFYAQGTKNYFDAFAVHGYWWNLNGTTVLPYWNAANKDQSIFGAFTTRIMPIMTKYGDQAKPVWWTESGISTQGQQTTETTQATKVDEAYTAFRNRVVPTMTHLYWYDITDSIGTGSEQNFGLVNLTGTTATIPSPSAFVAKPAYTHFQNQAKLF